MGHNKAELHIGIRRLFPEKSCASGEGRASLRWLGNVGRKPGVSKKTKNEAVDAGLSQGLRRYLYLTAAVTGAVIMIVEILGARMLHPFIGTSHFVWTAQIAVTLFSLAAGYYFGGWLVDRSTRLKNIYFCILGAAVYLAFTIGLCEPVAYGCLKFNLATGSILASGFLFFVPLTLLAATGPFLVRVLTTSIDAVGSQVGRLSAISTLGSALGTALIGYVLVPYFPNSYTMFGTAGALTLVVVGYFVVWGKGSAVVPALVIGACSVGLAGYSGVRKDNRSTYPGYVELARVNSVFGEIQIMDSEVTGYRLYFNDKLTQNGIDPETGQSIYQFTYMLHGLSRVYNAKLDDVLCIGLGVGIAPMEFARDGARVDVVEINPAIVDVAEEFFNLEPDKLNIVIDDGRHFLNECDTQYDAVALDAFLGDSSPSHLMTEEAFSAIKNVLKPGGTLVINSFGNFSPRRDFFVSSLDKTLNSVFQSVKIHNDGGGNVYFVAADRPNLDEFARQPDLSRVHPKVKYRVEAAYEGTRRTDPESGISLTDDFNPVEYFDAGNREDTRRDLAAHMRAQ
ncbi:MAG: spermidine synthase [Candidatus Binatia bacterium]